MIPRIDQTKFEYIGIVKLSARKTKNVVFLALKPFGGGSKCVAVNNNLFTPIN
jgi:hypothetical protein